MSEATLSSTVDCVRRELVANPDGVLEAIASRYGLPLLSVVECLPPERWKRISGEHFIDILQDISGWDDVTFIIHTRDVIAEFHGPLPSGTSGRGFYNLHGSGGLSGHLLITSCRAIVFLRRPFMGLDTLSVQFFNGDGDAMFKIFVSRDEKRRLMTEQVERFARLEARFAALHGS